MIEETTHNNAPAEPEIYMRRCFDLARLGAGKVRTNPVVGAVIVRGDRVIGEGYHRDFGGPHAEVNAIHSLSDTDLSSASIFVSLEPCSHFGKTSPCADLLVKKQIGACYLSQIDPNPLVSGKGIRILERSGIRVLEGLCSESGARLLWPFTIRQRHHRSYVILKWAQSVDGYLGVIGQRTRISSPASDRLVHKWRSEIDAIMVGSNTILVDDPHLGNRYYSGDSPIRVVLDRQQHVPESAKVLIGTDIPTIYYTSSFRRSENPLVVQVMIPEGENLLPFITKDLLQRDIGTVMVEGGANLLGYFLQGKLWDEIRIIQSPVKLGNGVKAPVWPEGQQRQWQLGQDRIIQIYR